MRKNLFTFLFTTIAGCVTAEDFPLEICYMPAGHNIKSMSRSNVDVNKNGRADFYDIIVKSEYGGKQTTITARHGYGKDKKLKEEPLWVRKKSYSYNEGGTR